MKIYIYGIYNHTYTWIYIYPYIHTHIYPHARVFVCMYIFFPVSWKLSYIWLSTCSLYQEDKFTEVTSLLDLACPSHLPKNFSADGDKMTRSYLCFVIWVQVFRNKGQIYLCLEAKNLG